MVDFLTLLLFSWAGASVVFLAIAWRSHRSHMRSLTQADLAKSLAGKHLGNR